MDIDRYDNIRRSADFKLFSFVSSGPRGDLLKLVTFTPFYKIPGTYNLALGTIKNRNEVDYVETSDNHDRDKVMATIFHIARTFADTYPNRKIFIAGRNDATTRLYRGVINHEFVNISRDFFISGVIYIEEKDTYVFESFVQNKKYDAFLFERR